MLDAAIRAELCEQFNSQGRNQTDNLSDGNIGRNLPGQNFQNQPEMPVEDFLYKRGKGKLLGFSTHLAKIQNKYGEKTISTRRATWQWLPNEENSAQVSKADKKQVCWDITKRGTVGETILHLCMLKASDENNHLVRRLLDAYPALVHDTYLGGEYFGETVLHMAVVNQDPDMVRFLLEKGADVNARACGTFFSPGGTVYWGEYPLSFAACIGSKECVEVLIEYGADVNKQDYHGNTAMHVMVTYRKKGMLDFLLFKGGRLDIKNKEQLTPLTLAAKLAYKDMYDHILKKEMQVFWIYNNVASIGYQLEHIDSISTTGHTNKASALHLIVFGEAEGHVTMMNTLIEKLLEDKWKHFAGRRFIFRFIAFLLYCAMFVTCIALRPGVDLCAFQNDTSTLWGCSQSGHPDNRTVDHCYLLRIYKEEDIARLFFETCVVLGALIYLILAVVEITHQKLLFYAKLKNAPSMALMLLGCVMVLMMVPGRATCAVMGVQSDQYEDVMGVLAILVTVPYFLFFCRGMRQVGPFVVMTYKILAGDLVKFCMIYAIFVAGFSQAFFIPFRTHEKAIFNDWFNSFLGLFSISVGGNMFDSIDELHSPFSEVTKLLFVAYMVMVTLLLINMLIAMMGNTYTVVTSTQKEWYRQWARIVLMIEESISPSSRLAKQRWYSQPTEDMGQPTVVGQPNVHDGRTYVIRTQLETAQELKEIMELRIGRNKDTELASTVERI